MGLSRRRVFALTASPLRGIVCGMNIHTTRARCCWIRWLAAAATAMVMLGVTDAVRAQHSSLGISIMNPESTFRPEFSPRDIRVFEHVLGLKPDEAAALQALYAGYADGLKSRSIEIKQEVDAALERAEVMRNRDEMEPAQKKLGQWEKQAEQMKKQFLEDLKALLTREQEQRWPIVERELRRAKQLGAGRLPGESVDLTRVLDDLNPKASEAKDVQDLLERYCEEMDHAIIARDEYTSSRRKEFGAALGENPEHAEELWREAQRLRLHVREVNDRYVRLLATVLGEKEGDALTRKVFELTHERVLQASKSEAYIRAASKLGTLEPEQARAMTAIMARYEREHWALIQRLAKAEDEDEVTWIPRALAKSLGKLPKDAEDGFQGRTYLPKDHPVMVLRRERYELDRATKEQVDKVLRTEQRAAVPQEREGWAQFADWTPDSL